MATILIGGGTGFIGKHLSERLKEKGHEVRHLSRSKRPDSPFETFQWDVEKQTIDDAAFRSVAYIINLTGAGIADQRWTDKRKQLIISSRTDSTKLLADTLKRLHIRPKLYLNSSAVGYYGNQGEKLMTEAHGPGSGFLSESCLQWEASVDAVRDQGIPVCINRTGIVLHPDNGALEKMLIPLNFFISTYFGNGAQFYSWIHIDDMVETFVYAIEHQLTGTYNAVAPHPARNKTMAAALGPAKGKPALVIPAPAFALKIALGEMSHTVLDSTRCSSAKLEAEGFKFKFPELEGALADLLG
ncbi:TIGR01777 family oxidoreductase [Neolewinella persica]|uniref:TIGR01777 family oxidoreductase n=1 Tax=Neolewinella persica TaxID=70998 RepID=UPI000475807B|nr:TIGR01777 family oxidoreductase [Neolewinella persica]